MAWILSKDSGRYTGSVDVWSAQMDNRRWYRRLEEDGTYMYRFEDTVSDHAGLFGTAADTGAPAQITQPDDQVSIQLATSTDALACYEALLTLTRDIAGRLVDVANNRQALQAEARDLAQAANDAVALAVESRDKAATAGDDANRTRLIRLGIRHMLDAHTRTAQWLGPTANALGAYHRPVLVLSSRGQSIANQLYGYLV